MTEVTINDVELLPNAHFNLFSVTRIFNMGCYLKGNDKELTMRNYSADIRFYKIIETVKGALYCMYFKRSVKAENLATVKNQMSPVGKMMNIQNVHQMLGHLNEKLTMNSQKRLVISLI